MPRSSKATLGSKESQEPKCCAARDLFGPEFERETTLIVATATSAETRSPSTSPGGSRRASSWRGAAPAQLSPHEPPEPPPLHRRQGSTPTDRVELEDSIRENLAQGEKFHGATAKPGVVDNEALNGVIDLCLRDGHRDRIFWICDPILDANIQQRGCSHGRLHQRPCPCKSIRKGSIDVSILVANRVDSPQRIR